MSITVPRDERSPTAQEVIDFAGLSQPESVVRQWLDDLSFMASDCLDSLSIPKREAALRYLVAHYMSLDAGASVKSESLGDASWTFKDSSGSGIRSTGYGRMAAQIAPCLEGLDAEKQYTVRLV